MTKRFSSWLMAIAALSMAVATGLGAWASHGLAGVLDAAALASFETGVHYQFFHSLGLLAIAIHGARLGESRVLMLAAVVLVAGTVLFCGGVYAASFDGPGWIRRLAPVGGTGLMAAWVTIAAGVIVARESG